MLGVAEKCEVTPGHDMESGVLPVGLHSADGLVEDFLQHQVRGPSLSPFLAEANRLDERIDERTLCCFFPGSRRAEDGDFRRAVPMARPSEASQPRSDVDAGLTRIADVKDQQDGTELGALANRRSHKKLCREPGGACGVVSGLRQGENQS